MRNLYPVAHLDFGSICPLVHQVLQLHVVVYGIVMKFLFRNLVIRVFESEIEPIKGVQEFYSLHKKPVVDDTRYNVMSQHVLQLYN